MFQFRFGLLLLTVLWIGCGVRVPVTWAATLSVSGTVGTVSSVLVESTGLALGDFATGPNTNVSVANIILSNNNPSGFTVTISSLGNHGYFGLSGVGSPSDSQKIDYLYALAPVSGTLGTAEPVLPNGASLALGEALLNFGSSVSQATLARTYAFRVTTVAKPALFRGLYSETIVVTMSDL